MGEKRQFRRVPFNFPARYRVGTDSSGNECEVVNISRCGMAIRFLTRERIAVGARVSLEINLPAKARPVSSVIDLKWIDELDGTGGYTHIAGGQLAEIVQSDQQLLFEYACDHLLI